jgi:uncharacterized membrane protein YccC
MLCGFIFICTLVAQTIDPKHVYIAHMSATTAILLFFSGGYSGTIPEYILNRISMVAFGCIIIVLVMMLVFPHSPRFALEEAAGTFFDGLPRATAALGAPGEGEADTSALALARSSGDCVTLLPQAMAEPNLGFLPPFPAAGWAGLVGEIDKGASCMKLLRTLVDRVRDRPLFEHAAMSLKDKALRVLADRTLQIVGDDADADRAGIISQVLKARWRGSSADPETRKKIASLLAACRGGAEDASEIRDDIRERAADSLWEASVREGKVADLDLLRDYSAIILLTIDVLQGFANMAKHLQVLVLAVF